VAGVAPSDAPERPAAFAHPLDRPVETRSEQDVKTVLNAPAYLEPQHARREQAERMVRAWFEQRFGTDSTRADATGRLVRAEPAMAGSGRSCPVPVRAHTRQGGKIEVGAHCRATPAA
jgi:hypothetical protein